MLSRDRIIQDLKRTEGEEEGFIGIVPNPLKYSTEQVGPASIDLRLGRWFLLPHQSRSSQIDLSQEHDGFAFESKEAKSYYVPFKETFVIHPGRFVLASTLEWVSFPKNIGGYITGKSSLGRRGLIVETAAGIHPGFSGCLTLELYNCGEVPISITPGMRVCQIFFHEIVGTTGEPKTNFGGRRKPTIGTYKIEQGLQKTSITSTL
jgi:dCTP deaminase